MNINQIGKLTDESRMPFGKHKGEIMMDVPADYLRYLWNNGMKGERSDVANYIRANLESLKEEDEDGIWDRGLP